LIGSLLIAGARRTIRSDPAFGMKDPTLYRSDRGQASRISAVVNNLPLRELYQPIDVQYRMMIDTVS
jgi:hypothetical protein